MEPLVASGRWDDSLPVPTRYGARWGTGGEIGSRFISAVALYRSTAGPLRDFLEGAVERGIQVTCLRFDDDRFLGVPEQWADLNALPVYSKDEKTGPAGIE